MTDIEKHVRHLHGATNALAEARSVFAGELMVLAAAVLALVDTHPEPAHYAEALRRAWFQFGQPHVGDETDPALLRGIERMLAMLEEVSRAPLNLRPPRG